MPRGSKKEGGAIDWIEKVARAHGVAAARDSVSNILVRVPATPARETGPGGDAAVARRHGLREERATSTHDFERDPIRPVIDGEWVRAQGTTLGADNGIGVAAALAVPRREAIRCTARSSCS